MIGVFFSPLFQLYKLTSFNWNKPIPAQTAHLLWVSIVQTYILQLKLRQRLEHCTFIRRFNCTNLHPSTETNEQETANKNRICFNCTNLHPSTETSPSRPRQRTSCGFQLYKLTSFNWNWGNVLNIALSLGVSIVQTYILQLKQMSKRRPIKIESVSIVQTYILQLKRKNRI